MSTRSSARRHLRRHSDTSNRVRTRLLAGSTFWSVHETRLESWEPSFSRLPPFGVPLVQARLATRLCQQHSGQRKAPPTSRPKTFWSRICWCNLGVASRCICSNKRDDPQEAEQARSWHSVSSQAISTPAPCCQILRPPPDHRRSTGQSWPQFQRWCLAQARRASL
ncbi:uncharacterized protein LOC142569532 [Dermacentor variabilis]|uniref:uncharacterized protein LOC142569532 n=1 Tax=Dermacentor variabilis TaxID=34621 RepID=UPI003F5C9CBE